MRGLYRKTLGWLCAVAFIVVAAVAVVYWQFVSWADAPISTTDSFRIELLPGQSLSALATQLHTRKILPDSRRLLLLGRFTDTATRLQAGEYAIERDTTPRQLLSQLTKGEVITYDFRIEEGATIALVLQTLAAQKQLKHEVMAVDAEALHAELDLQTDFAEGMFFPDTYQFRRGASDRALLMRAHQAMLDELDAAWRNRSIDVQLTQQTDLVVLASIIEKETGSEEDRAQISQVFHKRLQDRMLLQTDPTVIYALGKEFDGNLTRAHLKIDSPFNTYRNRGLPPTPIALPSAASLRAAASPALGDYLYFVAKGDGSSQFSRTLAEHNAAVRRYQLNIDRGS